MNEALDLLAKHMKGPLGGNLQNPTQFPERRNQPLQAEGDCATGLPKLHRHVIDFRDTATQGIKNEQPWHRMAAFMLLSGRTNSEIALSAGVQVTAVSILRAQRWFQELLAVLANEQGQDIRGLVQAEAAASVEKLVALRDGADSERVQLAAAVTLLEQAHGKAVQKTISISATTTFASEKEELEAIQNELQNLRNQTTT